MFKLQRAVCVGVVVSILLLMSVPAFASQHPPYSPVSLQDTPDLPVSFTSSKGLTLHLPAGWFATESDGISLANLESLFGVTLRTGDEIKSYYPEVDLNSNLEDIAAAISANLASGGVAVSDPQSITLQDHPALQMGLDMFGIVGSLVIVFQLPDDTPMLMEVFALSGEELSAEQQALLYAIANAITFDAADVLQNDAATAAYFASMAPPEPLTPDQMPTGYVVLRSGVSFAIPSDAYQIGDDTAVYDSTSLVTADFSRLINVTYYDNEYANMSQASQFLGIIAPMMIALASAGDGVEPNLDDFRIEDYFEESTYADGRVVLRWAGGAENIKAALYMLELRPGEYVHVMGQQFAEADDVDFIAEVDALVDSLSYNPAVTPPRLTREEAELVADSVTLDCYQSTYDLPNTTVGVVSKVTCPAGCVDGGVWGTDIYTYDSSVCTAAVHAGVLDAATGGTFNLTMIAGQPAYLASERNGITSQEWGAWDLSFSVSPLE